MHATLSDVIADTAHNSIEAGASRVCVSVVEDGEYFSVTVEDNGKGMDEATVARAFSPFYSEEGKHDKRRVGLGLPILKQLCDATGGKVSLKSQKGVGTCLEYCFLLKHIDLPPLGDLAQTVLALFNFPGEFDLVFSHRRGNEEYSISKNDLVDAVGSLDSVDSLSLALEFLRSQEESLG